MSASMQLWKFYSLLFGALLAAHAMAADANATSDPGSRERAFVRALELFDGANSPDGYRAAAGELESIVADGYQNGAVFYNLGNACYRAGDYGRAILNYRKALIYRPRDSYLQANLEQALAVAPGRLAEPPVPWWSHVLFWSTSLSYSARVQMTGLGLMGVGAIVAFAFLAHRPRWYVIAGGLFIVTLGAGFEVVLNNPDATHRAVITAETVARKGTGKDYEPAFDQPLLDGAEFTVLNETADWVFGHFEGVGDGWVRREFVAQ